MYNGQSQPCLTGLNGDNPGLNSLLLKSYIDNLQFF